MTPQQRLAQIVRWLKEGGIDALVMGGHAVRYYGVDRNTIDFDLVVAVTTPDELRERLLRIAALAHARELPAWRRHDFARFQIGRLPDGREELLDFWIRNHLLADFAALKARGETGDYGGQPIAFLSLPDLLKSKETERETDWTDMALLEEIQDARHFAALETTPDGPYRFLTHLRSRRGFDGGVAVGLFNNDSLVARAVGECLHPVTYAFLRPLHAAAPPEPVAPFLDAAAERALGASEFASPKHMALVEVARRAHKRRAMDLDRADKQRQLE